MPKKRSFKQMREVAAQLPVQFTDAAMTLKGEKILEQNPKAVDAKGTPIDPEKWYTSPTRQMVNHYRRIKKLFNSGGYPAVAEYVNGVADLEIEAAIQHQQFAATLPAQPMSI